jgi:hypothetical protein
MPRPAAKASENHTIEILEPTRSTCRETIICDCCRQRKTASDFDLDGCGICMSCVECDDLLVDISCGFQESGATIDDDHLLE